MNDKMLPAHYNAGEDERHDRMFKDPQVLILDFVRRLNLNFDESCVVKYACRHQKKGGATDLLKAISQLQHVLSVDYDVHTQLVTTRVPVERDEQSGGTE